MRFRVRSRRWGVVAVLVASVAAACVLLYRAGVRDESAYFSVVTILALYEWVFLCRR